MKIHVYIAKTDINKRIDPEWFRKAIDFLSTKCIVSPESFLSKLNDIGVDKIDRFVNGDIVNNDKCYFEEYYGDFLKLCPEWRVESTSVGDKRKAEGQDDQTVHLFWHQFTTKQVPHIMINRKHKFSGLCSLHSTVITEHYLTAIHTKGSISSTYDISKYAAHTLSGDRLADFLLRDKGGSSLSMLHELCGLDATDTDHYTVPNPKTLPLGYEEACAQIFERVAAAPALISHFQVYPDFLETDKVSFTGTPTPRDSPGSEPMYHSMVLIGARKTQAGEYFFLLQNWWEGRYFIEVSGEYLSCCGAMIVFVNKPFGRRPELSALLCDAMYAETSVDAAEKYYER